MTIKELKELYGIDSDDAKVELIDGKLTLVEETPEVEFKFKVGDRVCFIGTTTSYVITDRFIAGKDSPAYKLDDCENVAEDKIELYKYKDITEQIKTFEDAVEWCKKNGHKHMVVQYSVLLKNSISVCKIDGYDIITYLKLRIITCALNEGWKPTFEKAEIRYFPDYESGDYIIHTDCNSIYIPHTLYFRDPRLAIYAAKQFLDIYKVFLAGMED